MAAEGSPLPAGKQAVAVGAPGGRRIGERLIEMGVITADQLNVALHEKQRSGKMLGAVLVDLGFISDSNLNVYLADASGHETFEASSAVVDPDALRYLPKDVATRFKMLPMSVTDRRAVVAMADPYDVLALDQLRRHMPRGIEIDIKVSTPADLSDAIDRSYGFQLSVEAILQEMRTGQADLANLNASADTYSHPVVRFVNALIFDAVKRGSSDIHFEPEAMFVRLRNRVDGVLRQIMTIHKEHWSAISHRLKIMAQINITEKLAPQDGRFSLNIGARPVDFRVATMPTIHGENIVLRVLDRTRSLRTLDDLGFSKINLELLERSLKRPEGMVLVCGPTGSGKTTTLYAMLQHISSPEVNIMTLEDPVEYEVPLIRQSRVREGSKVDFAEGVRALLRQDPDIILIGEVRDDETATMALRAAMTGHQVFTTLHANNSLAAFARLFDLHLQPGMVAGAVIAIVSQRLVLKLCPACKQARPATPAEATILGTPAGAPPPTLYHPVGCPECNRFGHKGRVAVTEVLVLDDDLDAIVADGAPRGALLAAARAKGFRSLAEDGLGKVLDGEVSLPALARAVDLTHRR